MFLELKAPSALPLICVSSIFLYGAATAAPYAERLTALWLGRKTKLRSVYTNFDD
jgi:hypothetical protein